MDLLRNGGNIYHINHVIVDKFLLKADVFGGPIRLQELFVEKSGESAPRALRFKVFAFPSEKNLIYNAKQGWNKKELLEWKDQGGKVGLNTKEHTK